MNTLLERFDALLGHLNAEEDDMALKLRALLPNKHAGSPAGTCTWRDVVSMTRDAWEDHTRYVEALEKEIESLTALLKRLAPEEMGGV